MFPFEKYPYTNFHDLNLGYFLTHFKEIFTQWESLYNEMQSWKTATEEELEDWKSTVLDDINAWETALTGTLDQWEDEVMAGLVAWKTAFQTLFDTTFSNLEDIKTDAEAARDAALTAQTAAEAAATAAAQSAATFTTDTTLTIAGRAADAKATGDRIGVIDTLLEGKKPLLVQGSLNENTDLNDVLTMGIYGWTASHRPVNSPSTYASRMLVLPTGGTGNIFQIVYGATPSLMPYIRLYRNGSFGSWDRYASLSHVDAEIARIADIIDGVIKNVYFDITDFENGNINAQGQPTDANTHPLRTDFIDIEDFVSVDVISNTYKYQLFAYDDTYSYIGYGNQAHSNETTTREMVLEVYRATKYVRIKISGGDSEINLNPQNLSEYGFIGYTRISKNWFSTDDDTDINSIIQSHVGSNGYIEDSFDITLDLTNDSHILSITAYYEGTAPTIQIRPVNPVTGVFNNVSPVYELGDSVEPRVKNWRIPYATGSVKACVIRFTIPANTKLYVTSAVLRPDIINKNMLTGIKFHGHAGSFAPSNTITAFNVGSDLGYNSMITIPKFTRDGVCVCFHDDSTISGALCWMDGTAIAGADDAGISNYTYAQLTENFRLKSVAWGILHVPTLDNYFRVCSLSGMAPILSVHSTGFGTTWEDGFTAIKALAKKWNVLDKLGIKSGSTQVQTAARQIFGTDIGCYIFISGQTHAPYDILNLAKASGFVDSTATDLSDCEYNLVSEYFYAQTVSGATYYTETILSIATELSRGFKISIAGDPSGAEMHRLIGMGVTEFTVDGHISNGLVW